MLSSADPEKVIDALYLSFSLDYYYYCTACSFWFHPETTVDTSLRCQAVNMFFFITAVRASLHCELQDWFWCFLGCFLRPWMVQAAVCICDLLIPPWVWLLFEIFWQVLHCLEETNSAFPQWHLWFIYPAADSCFWFITLNGCFHFILRFERCFKTHWWLFLLLSLHIESLLKKAMAADTSSCFTHDCDLSRSCDSHTCSFPQLLTSCYWSLNPHRPWSDEITHVQRTCWDFDRM